MGNCFKFSFSEFLLSSSLSLLSRQKKGSEQCSRLQGIWFLLWVQSWESGFWLRWDWGEYSSGHSTNDFPLQCCHHSQRRHAGEFLVLVKICIFGNKGTGWAEFWKLWQLLGESGVEVWRWKWLNLVPGCSVWPSPKNHPTVGQALHVPLEKCFMKLISPKLGVAGSFKEIAYQIG